MTAHHTSGEFNLSPLWLRFLVFPLAIVLLSACGDGGSTETSEGDSDTTAAAEGGEGLVVDGVELADEELWAAAEEEGSFTYYTSQSGAPELVEPFIEQTGLEAEVVSLGASRLFERIQSESASGVLPADVIETTDISLATEYNDDGMWEAWEPDAVGDAPPEVSLDWCDCFVSYQGGMVIAYNTELVDEGDIPRSWEDLLDDRWAGGRIGLGTPTGGSSFGREAWLRSTYELEYWETMSAQDPALAPTNGNVMDMLARGEVEIAPNLPSNVGSAAADGASVDAIIPEDGVPAYSLYIGLVPEAENRNAAEVFLNWLTSPLGQQAHASLGNFAVMPGAPGPEIEGLDDMPSREEANLVEAPDEVLLNQRDAWLDEWFEVMGADPSDFE